MSREDTKEVRPDTPDLDKRIDAFKDTDLPGRARRGHTDRYGMHEAFAGKKKVKNNVEGESESELEGLDEGSKKS